jgi:hypothetical protein
MAVAYPVKQVAISGGGMMDTKTLVVGQTVRMEWENYEFCGHEGKVVKVTPDGVEVQMPDETVTMAATMPTPTCFGEVRSSTITTDSDGWKSKTVVIAGKILRFDSNGCGYDDRGCKVECCPVWDTTKLVVGQEVFMASGCYFANGKVVKVTPEGVEVHLPRNPLPGPDNVIRRFDTKGRRVTVLVRLSAAPI